MSFLLDTNICSTYIRHPGRLAHQFIQHGGGLFVPTIVMAELFAWAERRGSATNLMDRITNELVPVIDILDYDLDCAREFGPLRGWCMDHGVGTNSVDLFIASVALVHGLTVVTNNVKDFAPLPGLHVVDLLTP
jgi:tRNA(fMet)-specific endonuclease VapC